MRPRYSVPSSRKPMKRVKRPAAINSQPADLQMIPHSFAGSNVSDSKDESLAMVCLLARQSRSRLRNRLLLGRGLVLLFGLRLALGFGLGFGLGGLGLRRFGGPGFLRDRGHSFGAARAFLDLSGTADALAEVMQLGAANAALLLDLDRRDAGGVDGED